MIVQPGKEFMRRRGGKVVFTKSKPGMDVDNLPEMVQQEDEEGPVAEAPKKRKRVAEEFFDEFLSKRGGSKKSR